MKKQETHQEQNAYNKVDTDIISLSTHMGEYVTSTVRHYQWVRSVNCSTKKIRSQKVWV